MAKLGLPVGAAAALCIIIASSAFAESFLSRLANLGRPSPIGSKQQDRHQQSFKSIGVAGSGRSWPQQATTSEPVETTTTTTTTTATSRAGSSEQRRRGDDLASGDTLASSVLDELGRSGANDADDDDEQEQQQQQQPANGTAILEDLVNQFLEKNRDAVQQAADEQSNHTFGTNSRHQKAASSGEPSGAPVAAGGQHETELAAASAGSAGMPFMQLIALPTRPTAFETGAGESSDADEPDFQDSSYQELDDRHIQYDQPQVAPVEPAQPTGGGPTISGAEGQLERRLGQASGGDAPSSARKSAHDEPGSPVDSQPVSPSSSSSSIVGASPKDPPRAISATTNQTGAGQESATTADSVQPATQIRPPVAPKSSPSSSSSAAAGDPIASAAFTTIAKAATAIESASPKPGISARALPAAMMAPTNQTQLLVAALGLQPQSSATAASAASARIQARAMSSVGAGSQMALAGQVKTAHSSKPPYATHHEQFHDRLGPVVVAPTSSSPSTGAEQQQQVLEKRHDGESVGQQHPKLASGGTNSSQNTSASAIANAVNQISSHLSSADATRLASSTSSSSSRQQDSLSLLEDRQLQKLAPASQLVELHPIPAQPHLPSERFYFSKENQLFSAFPLPNTIHRDHADRLAASEGAKLAALLPADETFPDYSAPLFLRPAASMLDGASSNKQGAGEAPNGDEFAHTNNASSQPTTGNRLATRNAVSQQLPSQSAGATAVTAAHDSKNGAADLRLNQLAGSTAPASVQRKTLESVSNQLQASSQHSSGAQSELAIQSGFTIDDNALSDHAEDGPFQQQQQAAAQLMQRTAPANSAPFAASLINVTAPMVPPLSATEAMESALGDQAGKNILRQVSGFLRPTQPPVAAASLTQQQIDHLLSAAAGAPFEKAAQTQRQGSTHHQYFLPPAGALLEAQQQLFAAQQPLYSQPANQFSPRPFIEPTTAASPSAATVAAGADSAAGNSSSSADKERMRLDGASNSLAGSFQLLSGGSRPKGQLGASYAATNASAVAAHQASGFRSPSSSSSALAAWLSALAQQQQQQLQGSIPSSYLAGGSLSGASQALLASTAASGQQFGEPTSASTASSSGTSQAPPSALHGGVNPAGSVTSSIVHTTREPYLVSTTSTSSTPTTNGFITASSQAAGAGNYNQDSSHGAGNAASIAQVTSSPGIQQQLLSTTQSSASAAAAGQANNGAAPMSNGLNRRVFNLTRVEHISAECSNDLIRTVIVFNGTFKGIIYSSGYVRDPSCMYVNGTGKNKYEFSIRLNQCGTLGRQELHSPTGPNEVRRRDQVMWNTLSIQYNPIIEQEWDEHFRVSCEYGSDFWKTVSFSPFNVETNTGSPVVFTVDPPQCQMEILRGHGMVGPRQEQVSGPVTVGDPLTLLIHMKSERAGYDILVKNCIAHNGGHQKMQLIDSNGCVVNERFISPFRGTYNDNDLKHVTLYSYLKAFRFTGSPVLYLECEIHMCQSSCPPQMCYWRRLSKRAAPNSTRTLGDDSTATGFDGSGADNGDESPETLFVTRTTSAIRNESADDFETPVRGGQQTARQARKLSPEKKPTGKPAEQKQQQQQGQISDKVSLFQALEVRQEREPDAAPYSIGAPGDLRGSELGTGDDDDDDSSDNDENKTETSGRDSLARNPERSRKKKRLFCYSRLEVLAFLITSASILLVALTVTVGCCWREASIRQREKRRLLTAARISSANLRHCGGGTVSSYQSSNASSGASPDSCSYSSGQQAAYSSKTAPAQTTAATNILSALQQHQQHSARHKERLLSSNY